MGTVLGDLLPLALGVAISPIPIIAVILMLLAPRAKAASIAFLAGWLVGMTAVVVLVSLVLGPVDDSSPGSPSTTVAVILLALGVGALLLALREWRSRPRAGQEPELPKWMAAVDTISPVRAGVLAVLLAAVNPKNLTLALAAGVTIATGDLGGGQTAVAILVFVVIASSTVSVPVLCYLAAQARMQRPLDELRLWLTSNNSTVMSLLMLVIGAVLVGKGWAGLT